MKIITVDDEKIALAGMMNAIKEAAPEAETAGFRDADSALAYAKENGCDVALLDIQLRSDKSGIDLAKDLKCLNPSVNIIFTTGYDEYLQTAFDLHANGYLKKPITADKIRTELAALRQPWKADKSDKLQVRCFGKFEVRLGGEIVSFRYSKTKELLAYMVDQNGAAVSGGEICAALWEDEGSNASAKSYLRNIYADLKNTLASLGVGDVLVKGWNSYSIYPDKIWCDYYEFLKGTPGTADMWQGEYMTQYSWAEPRTGWLFEKMQKK